MSDPVIVPEQQSSSVTDYYCRVIANTVCGAELKLLHLKIDASAQHGGASTLKCTPGQFVMLDLPTSQFYFRRPFSVLDMPAPDELLIYYKRVGLGTSVMWELEAGNKVRCLAPLGKGFPQQYVKKGLAERPLFIGGGIGIAPLIFQASRNSQHSGTCVYGVRTKDELGVMDWLTPLFQDRLYVTTDNGTAGTAGNVCTLLEVRPELVETATVAYICGPTVMMKAASQLLKTVNPELIVYVSLEEHMPCGTGACTGCVVSRTDSSLPSKVCLEGPVFLASTICWPETDLVRQSACTASEKRNNGSVSCQ